MNLKSAPSDPPGIRQSLSKLIFSRGQHIAPKPVSTSTGSGQEIVSVPVTVARPPNATAAVEQQLKNATPLATNIATGSGIGAGQSSVAVTFKPRTSGAYIALAALGAVLLLAVAWDAGKL